LTVFLAVIVSFICASVTWAESPVWGKDISPVDISSEKVNPDRVIAKFKQGISKNTTDAILAQQGLRLEKTLRYTGISILEVEVKGKPVEHILEALRKSGIVKYVEPDYRRHLNAIPDDPLFDELWGLHNTGQSGGIPDADIDAPEAWDIRTGAPNVVVGVIDTGVDYNHQDLAANMWVNTGEIPGNGFDDDGNGYIDDIHGIDPCNGDSDPMDDNNHGTHVSGTIGAVGNNAIGVVGVNWDVWIMALKFLDASGSGWTSDAIECLNYAIMMKSAYGFHVMVTSNSWGSGDFSQALKDAIEVSGNAGMLFIAAAGNDGTNNDITPYYPSSYGLHNIMAVAATNRNNGLAYFSNYGPTSVDLGAPGHQILSTIPGNHYSTYSGTSMATPHVSGAAALLFAQFPEFDCYDIKETILSTVDPLASLAGMVLSEGRLNLYNAVTCDPGNPIPDIKANGSDDPLFVTPSESVDISISLDPGDMAGEWADWWGILLSSYGTFPLFGFQYPLFELPLPDTSLFSRSWPVGWYIFLFGLDDVPDGVFELDWYDYVVVVSQPAGTQLENIPNFDDIIKEKMRELTGE
jgi:subtilisin family serine protease